MVLPRRARRRVTRRKFVYVIRHGEAEHNVDKAFLKCRDTQLTAKGRRQALALKRYIANLNPDVLVTSPVLRALQTSKGIGFKGRTVVVPDAREMAGWQANCPIEPKRGASGDLAGQFGDYDWSLALRDVKGLSSIEKYKSKEYQRTNAKVLRRARRLTKYLEKLPETKIVLVSHGEFLMHLTGDGYMDNCEVRAYKVAGGEWRRSRLNLTRGV